jgi:hypothetical protein
VLALQSFDFAHTKLALFTVCEHGSALLRDEVIEMEEPEGAVSFLWTLARKPR